MLLRLKKKGNLTCICYLWAKKLQFMCILISPLKVCLADKGNKWKGQEIRYSVGLSASLGRGEGHWVLKGHVVCEYHQHWPLNWFSSVPDIRQNISLLEMKCNSFQPQHVKHLTVTLENTIPVAVKNRRGWISRMLAGERMAHA